MIRSFRPSPPTVGVELEWQLVDETTMDLRDGIVPLIEVLSGDPYVKPEMLQPAVETITSPAENTAALRPGLVEIVSRVVDAAGRFGMAVVGAGTHAFCERIVPITPLPRYLAMERSQGYLAHAYVAYSLQTHVGMPSGEVAVRVMRELRRFVPVLLALSASSPFFRGHETPFASYRQRILATSRTCGMPPVLEDWRAFVELLDTVERASMFGSFRDMHWDVRLRPDLGTIEVRVMDAQPTLARSLALSALVHSLLVHLAETTGAEERPALAEPLPWWIEKENAFRASHEGLGAWLVSDRDGTVTPLRRVAEDMFDRVAPTARRLGEEDDLARARALVLGDPCCLRQRAVFRSTGSTREVVRALANELRDELERPRLDRYDAADSIGAP